jgi:hypothetical protein
MAKQKMVVRRCGLLAITRDFATKMPPQMGLKIDGDFKSDFPALGNGCTTNFRFIKLMLYLGNK